MVTNTLIRVPEKKYIQVLVAGKYSASLVVDDLLVHKIPVPTNEMRSIYNEVIKTCPSPTYFKSDSTEDPPPEWLESLDLDVMFAYRFNRATDKSTKGCKGAFAMLEDPKMVKFIHTLSLAGVNQEDLELILNAKYNISYESNDFEMFYKYFANYVGWSYTDKEMYIGQVQDPALKKLYRMALTNDRSQLIWELGLGTDPTASFDEMLKDMFTDSYFYFKQNVKYNAENALRFATLATKISDRMDQIKDKNAGQQDLFADLKFKLQEDSTKGEKTKVIDASELDVEIPEQTEERIPDLNNIMNNDGANKPNDNTFNE